MQFLNGFLCTFASENQTPNCEKSLNYVEKTVFVASRPFSQKIASAGDFYINLASFWFQKPTKIASWGVLGASWRPLGPSWAHLEASWWRLGASGARLGASGSRLPASGARLDWNYVIRPPRGDQARSQARSSGGPREQTKIKEKKDLLQKDYLQKDYRKPL